MKFVCLNCGSDDVRRLPMRRGKLICMKCFGCELIEESVNGRNWKTFAPENSRTAEVARDRARAGLAGGTSANAVAGAGAGKSLTIAQMTAWMNAHMNAHIAAMQQNIAQQVFYGGSGTQLFAFSNPGNPTIFSFDQPKLEPPSLPVSTEVGEIEAWRIWRVHNGLLMSCAHSFVWNPGGVVTGDVDAMIPGSIIKAGVYAHKSRDGAEIHAIEMYWFGIKCSIVVGRVHLWGDVIEHEKGYRASNARIIGLDEVRQSPDQSEIIALRQRYGVGE